MHSIPQIKSHYSALETGNESGRRDRLAGQTDRHTAAVMGKYRIMGAQRQSKGFPTPGRDREGCSDGKEGEGPCAWTGEQVRSPVGRSKSSEVWQPGVQPGGAWAVSREQREGAGWLEGSQ